MLGGLRTRAGTARVEKSSRVCVLVSTPVRSSYTPQPSRAAAVAGPAVKLTKSQVFCQVRDSRGVKNPLNAILILMMVISTKNLVRTTRAMKGF